MKSALGGWDPWIISANARPSRRAGGIIPISHARESSECGMRKLRPVRDEEGMGGERVTIHGLRSYLAAPVATILGPLPGARGHPAPADPVSSVDTMLGPLWGLEAVRRRRTSLHPWLYAFVRCWACESKRCKRRHSTSLKFLLAK